MRPEFLKQVRLCLIGGLIAILLIQCSPYRKGTYVSKKPLKHAKWGMDRDTTRWLSWNILLQDGISQDKTNDAISSIEQRIQDQVRAMNPDWKAKFSVFCCKCDNALVNLAVNVVDGQDRSVSPPGGIPPTGGGGDVLAVSFNSQVQRTAAQSEQYKDTIKHIKLNLTPVSRRSDKVLAILDTGIDTFFFPKDIQKLIWKAPSGKLALYNFLGGGYNDKNNKDDHPFNHGSGVAGVALTAMNDGTYPQLMILKVLDSNKKGTTFTFNCALSYAIQNHATVINASLGYEEVNQQVDSVLYTYLKKCRDTYAANPIYVFTAAGNIINSGNLCDNGPAGNELRPNRMFYPGCFSETLDNVINVTGLTKDNASCRFQNYSNQYVTLGVLNNPGCCKYFTSFFTFGFDGTSFATPAAAGMIMKCHMANAGPKIPDCILTLRKTASSGPFVTMGGHYLEYTGNPTGLQ